MLNSSSVGPVGEAAAGSVVVDAASGVVEVPSAGALGIAAASSASTEVIFNGGIASAVSAAIALAALFYITRWRAAVDTAAKKAAALRKAESISHKNPLHAEAPKPPGKVPPKWAFQSYAQALGNKGSGAAAPTLPRRRSRGSLA